MQDFFIWWESSMMLFYLISILLLLAFCTRCSSVIKVTASWLFCAWKLLYYVYQVTRQNLFQILLLFYDETIPIKNTLLCSMPPILHYCFSLNTVLSLHMCLMLLVKMGDMNSVLSYLFDISTSWGVWLQVFFYRKSIKVGSDNTTLSGWAHCLHVHKQKACARWQE